MRRLAALVLAAACGAALPLPAAADGMAEEAPVRAVVGGQALAGAYLREGRVQVAVRALAEALGYSVAWDARARAAVVRGGGREVRLAVGSVLARVNGAEVRMDVPPALVHGRLVASLRFVAEALGARVHWEAAARTARVDAGGTDRGEAGPPEAAPSDGQGARWRELSVEELVPELHRVMQEALAGGDARAFHSAWAALEGRVQVLLVWSQLPTSGYDLRVERVRVRADSTAVVEFRFVEPAPDAVTLQVISHVVRAVEVHGARRAEAVALNPEAQEAQEDR